MDRPPADADLRALLAVEVGDLPCTQQLDVTTIASPATWLALGMPYSFGRIQVGTALALSPGTTLLANAGGNVYVTAPETVLLEYTEVDQAEELSGIVVTGTGPTASLQMNSSSWGQLDCTVINSGDEI